MKSRHLFFVVTALLLLFSCTSDAVFNKTIVFSNRTWSQKQFPSFKINIQDTSKTYDFILNIRTTTDFAYSNLWMFFTIDGPLGKSKKFPIEMITAKPSGEWTGKKSGSMVSFSKLLMHDDFPKKGTYTFTFEQATTQKKLHEVVDLTFDVFEAKSMN
ncbi:MAG: hypothetical protein EBR91_07400 [Flavobacteriia bacterium]|jgi:gliding motility-associated lipoprotein GldH|nr:hypothetical protein [Flavobacteriia bacterium]